ncbi:MAG: SanA/YdcF family protein [Aeromonas sp.]
MKKFAKILLASLLILLALIASVLTYSEWIVSDARHYTYDQVDEVPYNRVAVVLGTSKYLAGGGPNHYFKYRIKAAAELYNNAKVDFIIVSGDNATMQYNEPRQMRRALIKAGIPSSAIYMDFAGFRTLDSVVRAREVFGQSHFTVVSQGFHNERAIFIARHFGIDAVGFNAEDPSAYQGLRTRVREVFARLMGLLDLYVLDKGPKFLGEPVPIGLPVPCHSLSTIGTLQPCLKQSQPAVAPTKTRAEPIASSTTSAMTPTQTTNQLAG